MSSLPMRALVLATIAAFGCGKADQTRSWNGSNDNFNLDQDKPAGGITGTWHGGVKDKRDDAPTKLMAATVVLNTDKTYLITLDDIPSAGAGGTYIQFQDTILFTVTKSAMSMFGLAGTQRDMSYSLFGKTLTMFDKQIEFKLEVGGAAPAQAAGEIPTSDPLLGKWQGRDKKENDWYLAFDPAHVFTARVENPSSNALHLEGTMTIVPDSEPERAELSITTTNNPETATMTINVEYAPASKKLKVVIGKTVADSDPEEIQTFYMSKI